MQRIRRLGDAPEETTEIISMRATKLINRLVILDTIPCDAPRTLLKR